MERRRRLLDRGRVGVSRHQQVQLPQPPPGRGPSPSQGPAHGQGLGVGLSIMALGSKPGGQQGGSAGPTPRLTASASTARPGANVGSLAVNLPTYVANDHVLILVCGDFLLGTDTSTAAGWTQDGFQANGNQLAFAYHRKMVGNEGASVTFTFNNAFERPFAIAATCHGASGLEASIIQGQNGAPASTWSLPNLVTTGPTRAAVTLIYSFSALAGTDFTTIGGGGQKIIDVTNTTSPNGWNAAAMIATMSAPVAGSYTMSGSLSNVTQWLGVEVALKP